jgi:hypothetical protein
LEYIFSNDVTPGANYNGLVQLNTNNSIQLFDFVKSGSVAEVFMYCGGVAAVCTTEDDKIPINYTASVTVNSAVYSPTSSQPGSSTYCTSGPTNCTSAASYGVLFDANSDLHGTAVPEPTSVILFGSVALLVGGALRRKLARS